LPLPHLNAEEVVEQRNDKIVVQRLDAVSRVEISSLPEREIERERERQGTRVDLPPSLK